MPPYVTGVVWYGMVWYGVVWYDMEWYGMVWYGMVWKQSMEDSGRPKNSGLFLSFFVFGSLFNVDIPCNLIYVYTTSYPRILAQ